jgi:transcription-repair coupling factor (superfamily II helicase)
MFFVHNRVSNIENIKVVLQNIFPNKKIIITHGQLPWVELEKRIIAFKNKKYDILLSTTVIENWIDFSNVNTIIINNAESFGLSQIHQLRWRVWRSDKKWYCHLLYKGENIKPETAKRLKTIVEYSYVWAWFELAMKDLEIRGWWDLLGFRQSGQSSQVWINLYLKIIEEKILELQNKSPLSIFPKGKEVIINKVDTKIDIDLEVFIPDDFFGSELDKINFYREVELISSIEELQYIKTDLLGSNTKTFDMVNNLFNLLELKIRAKNFFITYIKKVWINYQIDFHKNTKSKELKKLLDLDKQVKFKVISAIRLRSEVKNFANNKKFIEYMLSLFKWQNLNSKIKLKWKK